MEKSLSTTREPHKRVQLTEPTKGNFSLQFSPGDYNLMVSAAPPASNISPAFIVGYASAYVTPSVVDRVAGVNVTLSPHLPERDVGGSCLTDSDGFFNVTVWPYYPLKSYSTTVRLSEGAITSIDVDLEPFLTGQPEPSTYYITFTHPEYPVGPDCRSPSLPLLKKETNTEEPHDASLVEGSVLAVCTRTFLSDSRTNGQGH